MNWFSSFRTSDSPPKDCDPTACMESFKRHWQQAYEILRQPQHSAGYNIGDDVSSVLKHLHHMTQLLTIELQQTIKTELPSTPSPCLEHLLSENILARLYNWSMHTGRYSNAVKLEQLKLYKILVSQAGQQVLVHEPFLKPLLRTLSSCSGSGFPVEIEECLVLLLNELCISLMKNIQLLDLFFNSSNHEGPSTFVLFSMLVPFVHREENLGQQARDSLLFCMSMSKINDHVGTFITEHSKVCPVLATSLSGLYSLLPRKLEIETDDWHRLTPDDVIELPDLTLFMNFLEFCNAVIQVAHTAVKDQLLEYLYQGFLLPVMGPALLQDTISVGITVPMRSSTRYSLEASTVEELVAATAYYELFLRNSTNPGLLQTLTSFLLCDCYDGQRILNTLVSRINSPTRLSLVTLALLETLINLDSEDVMHELVFKHLVPCTHVMLSQRRRLKEVDPYSPSAARFLSLIPSCCTTRNQQPSQPQSMDSLSTSSSSMSHVYGLRPEISLYSNYHAYLCDARHKIKQCAENCRKWNYLYDGESPTSGSDCLTGILNSSTNKISAIDICDSKNDDNTGVSLVSSGYASFVPGKGSSETTPENEPSDNDNLEDSSKNDSPRDLLTKSTNYLDSYSTPDIGPFLDALFKSLEKMPKHSLYVNLRLTGIISRLAVYPQPLLSSLLLNHSLVFQPSIRSLFQVLGSLKQRLDREFNKEPNIEELVSQARDFLLERECRLGTRVPQPVPETPLQGRKFTSSMTTFLKLKFRDAITSAVSSNTVDRYSLPPPAVRYVPKTRTELSKEEEQRNAVMCAVVLEEWLKELAAIAQEHTLYALS